ncbi:hypothetical protein D3C81_1710020 [compost metagenome]
MVLERTDQQAFARAFKRGLDHHGAFGHGPGIAEAAGGIGRADQEDQLLGPAQCEAGNGGMAVMEGLETPDEHQIVVFHENPPCRCRCRGSIPWLVPMLLLCPAPSTSVARAVEHGHHLRDALLQRADQHGERHAVRVQRL